MRKNAFTLIELLVVVSIIALLVAILLPTIHSAKLRAQEAVCMADTRTLTQACLAYAIDSGGLLPDFTLPMGADIINPPSGTTNSSQVYYIYTAWRLLFEKSFGIQRDQWYSPTNKSWNADYLYWWIGGASGGTDTTATYSVIGRFYLSSYKGNGRNATTSWMFNGLVDPLLASEWPLFPRRVNSKAHWSLMWTDLNREWHSYSPGYLDWTISGSDRIGANHLYGGVHDMPAGSHESHVDGHVEWVTGDDFQLRSHPNNEVNLWW